MKSRFHLIAGLLVLAVGCERPMTGTVDSDAERTAISPAAGESLYERLGGYEGIAAINDAIAERVVDDPDFDPFLADVDEETGLRARQLGILHLCEAAGGDCIYVGRDLTAVHRGMGITDEIWRSFMGHLDDALIELNIADPERAEVISIFAGARDEIVDTTQ